MPERMRLAEWLRQHAKSLEPKSCVVGFDGFTDEILAAVDVRRDVDHFDAMQGIRSFGERVVAAAGKSCNIELVVKHVKMGGNAPLMTAALLEGGHRVIFIGAIGTHENIEPLFSDMATRCEKVFPLCSSGHTDAVEFQDGKILLGKMGCVPMIDYDMLLQHLSVAELTEIFDGCDLFASVNWTMLPKMTELWQGLLRDVVPSISPQSRDKPRWMFVDLADPKKRPDDDLREAFHTLRAMNSAFRVVVGLNYAESLRVAEVLSADPGDAEPEALGVMAQDIQAKAGVAEVVIHASDCAAAATREGVASVRGPLFPSPKVVTGGGDNFNAGFCNGLLFGVDPKDALLMGVATSGYYVSHGASPTIDALTDFLDAWHDGRLPL